MAATKNINLPEELEIWNNMHPMHRLEVMQNTPYVKNINKRFKMCLAYIKANIDRYKQGAIDNNVVP